MTAHPAASRKNLNTQDKMKKMDIAKETYVAPAMLVVEVKLGGIVCTSESDSDATADNFTWN